MKKWLAFSVLMLPLFAVCGQGTAAEEEPQSFRVSNDATEEVIQFDWIGGMAHSRIAYTVYGDGRLVRSTIHQGNEKVLQESEVALSPADVETLVGLAVQAGLVEFTRDALLESVGGRMPVVADGLTARLKLRLEEYQGPAQSESAPLLDHEVRIHAPDYLARTFPEMREVRGLLDLAEALRAYAQASSGTEE